MDIYYFSRTNRSKNIALQISTSKNVALYKIDDQQQWHGKLGYIKAGAMAAKKESVPIRYTKINEQEPLMLVFPIWAGTLPPAIRQFMKENCNLKVTAVVTSAISSLKDADKALFTEVYEIKGKEKNAPKELL